MLWGQVRHEPIVSDGPRDDNILVADLGIRGVWSPQSKVLFDIRVCNTDTQSYLNHTPASILLRAECEKS